MSKEKTITRPAVIHAGAGGYAATSMADDLGPGPMLIGRKPVYGDTPLHQGRTR